MVPIKSTEPRNLLNPSAKVNRIASHNTQKTMAFAGGSHAHENIGSDVRHNSRLAVAITGNDELIP